MKIKAEIKGAKELQDLLRKFTPAVQRRILRPALNVEGTRVLQEARARVPVDTKLLRRSLGKRTRTYKNGTVLVIVGPRRGFKEQIDGRYKNPSKYAHLVEFGVKPHSIVSRFAGRQVIGRKKRQHTMLMHPGMKGRKPLTKAYKTALNGAAERMAARMAVEIEKLAAKGKLRLA